jgi:hypothetical protein
MKKELTMNAPASRIEVPSIPGTPYGGGFFYGRILVGDHLFALIVAPKDGGEHDDAPWNKSLKAVTGAGSYFDGLANTRAMAEAGSKLAKWALDLKVNGESDWYLPSRDELEILYRNLKPTIYENYEYRNGDNPSSVPAGYPYTAKLPAQTAAEQFRAGGAEAVEEAWHWTSTQFAPGNDYAWAQSFDSGNQNGFHENLNCRARAVRRLPI